MGIIFNLFVLSIGSIFGSVYLNKRYEEMLPMSVMSIIFILFIFYMLNIPLVGYYVIHLIGILLLIASAKKFFQDKEKRKEYLNNLFTPGLLIFGIVSFLIYLITKDNYVMLFDELRMWAAYPKSIFITNRLMIGKDLFFSTDYFPGMPLFQYFFAKNYGSFVEAHLYLSYGILMLSLLIPITNKITWKKAWLIVPTVLFLYSFPALFANSGFDALFYYKSIFIDPAMGLFFGYSLFLSTRKTKNNKFLFVLFCLSLSLTVLMKFAGVVLGIISLLSYFLFQYFVHKDFQFKRKKSYKYILIPALFLFLTFASWQLLIGFKLPNDSQTINSSQFKNAIQFITKPNNDQKEFTRKYIEYIADNTVLLNQNRLTLHYTLPNMVIFFIIIMILLCVLVNKKEKKRVILSLFVGIFSVFVFLLFYLLNYIFTFNYTILCYVRYLSPVLSGLSIFLVYMIVSSDTEVKNSKKPFFKFLLSSLVIIYLFNYPFIKDEKFYEDYKNTSDSLANIILNNVDIKDKMIKLMTIYNSCDSISYTCVLYQHQLYLSLMDDNIFVDPGGIYVSNNAKPDFYIQITNSNLGEHIKRYDYVLIVEDLNDVNYNDKIILKNEQKSGTLFKVEQINDDFELVKIE